MTRHKAGWALVVALVLLSLLPWREANACTCFTRGVAESKQEADVVFVGTVEKVEVVDTQTQWEPRVVVTFAVARVWKGKVGRVFQMHTSYEASSCGGFPRELAQPGKTLLVYGFGTQARHWKEGRWTMPANAGSASRVGDAPAGVVRSLLDTVGDGDTVYTTNICTRNTEVEYAAEDFAALGRYAELAPLAAEPSMAYLEALRPIDNGLPAECAPFTDARKWAPVRDPGKMAELVAVLESSSAYADVPAPRPVKYRDHFVVNAQGHVGLCRVSRDERSVCGEAVVEYLRQGDRWDVVESIVRTYCE